MLFPKASFYKKTLLVSAAFIVPYSYQATESFPDISDHWWKVVDFTFAFDTTEVESYSATSGDIDTLKELVSGTNITPTNPSFKATEDTISGHKAAQFSGKHPYESDLPSSFTLGDKASLHSVFKLGDADVTQRPVTIRSSVNSAAFIGFQYLNSKQINITFYDGTNSKNKSTNTTLTAGDGDLIIQSTYIDLVGGKITFFFSGAIVGSFEQSLDLSAFIGTTWDNVTIGGFSTGTTHVLTDGFFATGMVTNDDHSLLEARNIHRVLLDQYIPENIENIISGTWLSQSNGDGNTAGSAANQVTFADGTAYIFSNSTNTLSNTGVGHPAYPTAHCNNPLYWMMKEIQDQAAAAGVTIKPVMSIITAGGMAFTSSSLNPNANYLGAPDADGVANSKVSTYETQTPSWEVMDNLLTYTPKWNVLARLFVPQGLETDAGNSVPGSKVLETLNHTWSSAKADFNMTHCLVIELGIAATSDATMVSTEAKAEPIRQAQRDFVAANSDAYMIYDTLASNLPSDLVNGTFVEDNLVVDADGKRISGAGYYGVPHYSTAQYRSVGLDGGEVTWGIIGPSVINNT